MTHTAVTDTAAADTAAADTAVADTAVADTAPTGTAPTDRRALAPGAGARHEGSATYAPPARADLSSIAKTLAEQPDRWSPLVRFDSEDRYYVRLDVRDDYEAWLLTWLPGQSTGWHDHGGSSGAFTVVQGGLWERSLQGSPPRHRVRERLLTAGGLRAFGPRYVHDVTGAREGAVSIHVYSPALARMTRYRLERGRLSVTSRERAGADW